MMIRHLHIGYHLPRIQSIGLPCANGQQYRFSSSPTSSRELRQLRYSRIPAELTESRATCTSAFEPALPSIMAGFHSKNDSVASLTVSIYTIGYCLGPLIIAPMSELYGHVTVLYPGYVGFMLALAVCGSSRSLLLFIVFRAIMGFAAITFVLLGPAIVADLIPRERRGFALSIMSAGPVVVCTLLCSCLELRLSLTPCRALLLVGFSALYSQIHINGLMKFRSCNWWLHCRKC